MRCACGLFAGVVLAITIAGCGDTQPPSGFGGATRETSSADYSTATAANRALERADGDAMVIGMERTPTAAKSVPTVAQRDVRTSERKAAIESEPAEEQPAHSRVSASQFRPGTLTAGSIDDHANYKSFREYLSNTLQQHPGGSFPALRIGRRIVIRVANAQGDGIGDARITVRPVPSDNQEADGDGSEFSTATASDGRALFLSARDVPDGGADYLLTVQPAGAAQPVTQQVSLNQSEWNVVLTDAQQRLPTRLDLALVIDTTGSMRDELDYLKVEIDDIAAAVKHRFPNVEQRFALILYRDEGDEYVTRTFDFTGSLPEFRRILSRQSAGGGGDYPEAMHLALEQAERLNWRKNDAARVLFLVGDAPPHGRYAARTSAAAESLRTASVKVFPVAASGVRDEAEWVMRSAAFLTMGRYLFLTDHSGVGNPHVKPQAASYSVERLNALMVRMIASELAGRELLRSEIIATEAKATPLPAQSNQTTLPAQASHGRSSFVTARPRREASFTEIVGPWCWFCIESTAFRMFLAAIAIGLIWKLDTRRRGVMG